MSIGIPFHDARYMTCVCFPGDTPRNPHVGGDAIPPTAPCPGQAPGRGNLWAGRRGPPRDLLRVELDDELFLDLGVDLGPDGQRVHQDPQLVGDHLEPGGTVRSPTSAWATMNGVISRSLAVTSTMSFSLTR